MTERFQATTQGAVLEVVFEPPFGLDAGARAALVALLAAVPPGVTGIWMRAGTRVFSGGPDLPGDDDAAMPDLAALCAAVEAAPVPVTFLAEGHVAGALAEVALAAAHRVAPPDARIAIGAMVLGLISGAGGTQRLAALVGAQQALRVMQGGLAVPAAEALALGLIDRVIEAEGRAGLHAAARDLAGVAVPRGHASGLRDARGFLAAVGAARASAKGPAGVALVDCVEAAILLPRPQGLAFEAAVAAELATSREAAALCHSHAAERHLARLLAGQRAASVAHLGLVGAAMPLVGLVLGALSRGTRVTLLEGRREALVSFLKAIAARQEALVQAGRKNEAQRDADWARLVPVAEDAGLSACDLVIVTDGAGVPAVACPLLMVGRGALPPGAGRLTLSGRVAEVARPDDGDAARWAPSLALLRAVGLMALPTGAQSAHGIAGRLAAASGGAVRAMAAMGVAPEAIVAALTGFGLPSPATPEGAAAAFRTMDPGEIVNRLIAAMANEGARLMARGVAQSALEVDLVAVHGLGFPRSKGGPMHLAEARGLMLVRRDLTLWADEAEVWRPVEALDAFVSAGHGFDGQLTTA